MPNPFFKFKQFTIWHDQCAMKVGTDGVLAGAWAEISGASSILDIGTGTGLITLMCAQRSTARIDGIDIDEKAIGQAMDNCLKSPFHERIRLFHTDFMQYAQNSKVKYDHIISNPPFFQRSLKGPDARRNRARHTDTLPITDLLEKAARLLVAEGKISLILPFSYEKELETLLPTIPLYLNRKTLVFPMPDSEPKRLLVELGKQENRQPLESRLIIELSRHVYSEEYIQLTKDFYLKM